MNDSTPFKKTNESQGHGKTWEKSVQNDCFGMKSDEINSYGQTAKYDISSEHTKNCEHCSGMNISIKTSGKGNIDCGDIIRFLESENTKLICILYRQESEYKIAIKTICFDISDFIESIVKCELKMSYEEWIQKLKEYISYVKNIPHGVCDHSLYPYKTMKDPLCIEHFNIAPKVDSKCQRRVQCSVKIKALKSLSSYEEFEGGRFYDKDYAKKIYAPSRSRNGITVSKLKGLAKENDVRGYSKLRKSAIKDLLEEKGVTIPPQ